MPLQALPLQVKCSQEASSRAASSVFALTSCFPTLRTDFGGPHRWEGDPTPVKPPPPPAQAMPEGCGWAGGGQESRIGPSAPVLVTVNSPRASTGKREHPGATMGEEGGTTLSPHLPAWPRVWGQLQQDPHVPPPPVLSPMQQHWGWIPSPPPHPEMSPHPPIRDPGGGAQAASPHHPPPRTPPHQLTQCYTSLFINNIKYTSCFLLFSLNRLL